MSLKKTFWKIFSNPPGANELNDAHMRQQAFVWYHIWDHCLLRHRVEKSASLSHLDLHVLICCEEIWKDIFHFSSFFKLEMAQFVKILPRLKPDLVFPILLIPWLLMTWQRKEAGRQQQWYYWYGVHFTNDFSIVIQIRQKLYSAHPSYTKVVATKFCTWHNSCTVVACAKFCSVIIPYNEVTLTPIFHLIWITLQKLPRKMVPRSSWNVLASNRIGVGFIFSSDLCTFDPLHDGKITMIMK